MKYFLESKSGRSFEVEVSELAGEAMSVVINGRELSADFIDVDCRGQYAAILDWRSFAASIDEADEQHLVVNIAGESFVLTAYDERERAAQAVASQGPAKAEVIKASMPGLIISVNVAAGDILEAESSVAVLEAMKMQNEVCSQNGGVVSEVLVAVGDNVEANQPLVLMAAPEDSV
ncbi:MAG: biotin attachment protein [Planctomycetes bacterium]|nr:biotin attachment protein [Planctomycetota bacterium]